MASDTVNLMLNGSVVESLDAAIGSEQSCTTPEEDDIIEGIARIGVPILFGIIGIVGLIGNALVVVVVLFNAQMRNTTNILILNLAVSDLLFVVFCVPFTAVDYVAAVWPFGNSWCQTVQYLIVVTVNASTFTLVLMSLDRYLAVVHPIASREWRTERNTVLACALVWTVIVFASLPAWYAHGEVVSVEPNSTSSCVSCRSNGYCLFANQNRSPMIRRM